MTAATDEEPELELSVVIPLLDEEGSLRELHEKLSAVLAEVGRSYEILFVDDGSTDGGPAILAELAERDPRVGWIRFRRNFGKSAALDAGFERARGSVVITMDADLQDDPTEIPRFLEALEGGLDLVSGWKAKRHDPLGKTLPSKLFNFVVRRLSGLKLHDFNCGFKAYKRAALENLELYGDLHRYVPVLVDARGFRVGELAVTHHARKHGRSKYGIGRMTRGFFDLLTVLLLTRYRRRPLHFFGGIGLLSTVAGVGCLAFLTARKLFWHEAIGHRPLLILGLLLVVVGVQLFCTGLLAEMINHLHGRRRYFIRDEPPPRAGEGA